MRERGRCTYIMIYIYVCIYSERDGEREREVDR